MDRVLRSLGWMGFYQKVQFVLLMVPVIDISFHIMSFIFLGRVFEHKCTEMDIPRSYFQNSSDDVMTVTYGKCAVTVTNQSEEVFSSKCVNGYEYSEPRERSFVSEWDLVCEKGALAEVSQTFMSIGMMVGSSFMMTLADKYGRKPVYVVSHVLYFFTSVATAFAPTFTTLLGFKLAHGTFHQGTGLTSAIMLAELLPTERRAFPSQVGCLVWPSGLLCLGIICYLCRELSWRTTELVLAVFSCYSLLQWWLVEESLRWLDVQGKSDRAEQLIQKAAKRNKVNSNVVLRTYREDTQKLLTTPQELTSLSTNGTKETHQIPTGKQSAGVGHQLDSSSSENGGEIGNKRHGKELSFSTFLMNRSILLRVAVSCYMWFTDSMAYYGLLMISPSLADGFYLGYFLNVLVELPAGVALATLINRIGRRRCMIVSHLIGGFALGTAVLLSNIPGEVEIPGSKSIILTLSLLGKFGISLGFGALFVYTPELFPTTIRSTGFGISSVAARLGGMIAPYSRTLQRHLPWVPGTVFAALALVVPVLVMLLPETHGHELPQTVSDMEQKAKPVSLQRSPMVVGLSIRRREDTDIEVLT
ncbi:organic cation transporter-like protein [Elysia marginata]|uniref:Organic cation transporter-like protein n=1 Tax=Elysia marginata TaxID=1093978 RepID=A0AAV4HIN1_9GAST|nr:organic cation transporter-like protein [Elysia marginata]